MNKQIIYSILILMIVGAAVLRNQFSSVPTAAQTGTTPIFVIDAGHGGEDGGAVSLSGIPESQINLSVARKLEELLIFYGIPTCMTRKEDISLHDPGAKTLREKKVSDLHNRVSYMKSIQNPVLVSIHQNSYQDPRYKGAQVFFADTPGSDILATQIQAVLNESLNRQNARKPQRIPGTVYLLAHIDCPAVLVECGFLTNPEEETLLRQNDYQKKLSVCIAGAILTSQNPYYQSQENQVL